ncbi:MAG: hypothetical protein ACLPTQ_19785 [Terriglobales bacterium]
MIEQAIETAARMLGTDKSRGYRLEMICADFLAGANLENEDPQMLLYAMARFFKFLPGEQRQAFLGGLSEKVLVSSIGPKPARLRLDFSCTRSSVTKCSAVMAVHRDDPHVRDGSDENRLSTDSRCLR